MTQVADDYRDGIIFGALWRLLRMPQRDWSDPQAAVDYAGLFSQTVQDAEIKARRADIGVGRKDPFALNSKGPSRNW